MKLDTVDVVDEISKAEFQRNYFKSRKPLVIKQLSKQWPAFEKWNWDYFQSLVGDQKVGIYNNVKSDAYTPINTADDYTTFGKYIDMVRSGPAAWRIFLFNIFDHAPQLMQDFTWPDHLMSGFVKKYPMLFVGGEGSITHMHFDIDTSHIFHTQFIGRKRVLLFPFEEQHKLYRKPFEVLSIVDFSRYYEQEPDYNQFPALRHASGYEVILEHGDTLFMPGGYWHHMEYLESGFAMSLRALQETLSGKLQGVWNLFGMRTIDTVMKKQAPLKWYGWKKEQIKKREQKILQEML
ncbi:MAG: cupin-like domain-containing protein [Hydrotalea sp.]|nr:cupin-like domain-containing protein [Hydrotalea sp.]